MEKIKDKNSKNIVSGGISCDYSTQIDPLIKIPFDSISIENLVPVLKNTINGILGINNTNNVTGKMDNYSCVLHTDHCDCHTDR